MKSALLNLYKNKKTAALRRSLAAGFVLALAAIAFAGCPGAENTLDIPQTNTGGSQLREGPPAEVRLKSLNVYYSNDPVKKNLATSFNSAFGDFTVTDADTNQDQHVTVEAEAAVAEASVLISWAYGDSKNGKMPAAVTGEPAVLGEIAVPEQTTGSQTDTLVSITVVNGSKKYTTTVRLRAPGADSSLETLSVKLSGESQDELLPLLGFGDTEKEDLAFISSVYQYAASLATAEASIVVTAKAASADSVITLTQDGAPVIATTTLIEADTPAAGETNPSILASEGVEGEPDGPGLGETPLETAPEFYLYSWTITGGAAGANASKIVLTSVNKASGSEVSSKYTVTLVPPADTSAEDAHLSYLQFRYGNLTNAIAFDTDELSYHATVPNTETTVKLTACAPRGKGAAAVAYKTVKADGTEVNPGTIADLSNLPSDDIALPDAGSGDSLVVTATVTVEGKAELTMVYTVAFTKPSSSYAYLGSINVTGDTTAYTLTSLSATTSDGGSVDVSIEDGDKNWAVAIDKSKGAPVTFTAKFLKVTTGVTYTKMYSPSTIQPNVKTALTFSLTSTSADPLYRLVQTADDLAKIATTENYFLANNIDLSTLNNGEWEGPKNYKGRFNGNNKTITLSLSKTTAGSGETRADTGLFTSLDTDAIIENLQVAVSTKGGAALAMEASSHFGGVVGFVGNGTYTIRGVRVRGSLMYSKGSNYLLAGALIGEIVQGADVTILIENCESDITITGNVTGENSNTDNTMFGFGGLIGKSGLEKGSVTIKNSRTSGKIAVTNNFNKSGKASSTFAGGLIGVEGRGNYNADATKCALIIENCYSTMEIVITSNQSSNTTHPTSAGGLIGSLSNNNSGSKIINSFALNQKVLAIASSGASSGRVIGKRVGFTAGNASLSNYALNGMFTGTSGSGEANDKAGSVDSDDGAAQDSNFFNVADNWKAKSFTDANWDFTQVAANGYPALKFK